MGIVLKPFALLVLFFYNFFQSYGLALILFAVVVKLILFPVTLKSKKSMIQMNMISGKMQQLQKQYGKDRERYNIEVQKLYEKEKVNPMGGCVWSLIPMVLLIALYYIIREPLVYLMDVPKDMIDQVASITGIANSGAYPQIAMAEALNDSALLEQVKTALGEAGSKVFAMDFTFLGLKLSTIPTWKFWADGISWNSVGLFLLPLVSVGASFLSMKISFATSKMNNNSSSEQMDKTNRTMMWMMPLLSLWIGFTVPAGLSVYWIAQYVVNIGQEIICGRLLKKDYEAARAAAEQREKEEKEEEKRRKEEARLERARRIEEEKKNKGKKKPIKKKDDEPEKDGVNKNDSREGIRAYARGRAYIPNRFGGVTPYVDPNEGILAQNAADKKNKKGKAAAKGKETQKDDQVLAEQAEQIQQPQEQSALANGAEDSPALTQPLAETEEAETEEAETEETEEIEIEVEETEIEVEDEDNNKEGV